MKINTRALTGFMELIPSEQAEFDKIKNIIEQTYFEYGFSSIDTPIVERTEVLLAKAGGETEKQIYRFNKGDNDLSLRFDLTVPTARYVADHFNDLTFPFKRYQIGKVYRGERAQKGRYREFYQCDIDVIGHNGLSLAYDSQIIGVMYQIFNKLNLAKFTIRLSNRNLLKGLLEFLELSDRSDEISILIDKAEKIGRDGLIKLMGDLKIPADKTEKILDFIKIKGSLASVKSSLDELNIQNETFARGVDELTEVYENTLAFGVDEQNLQIDLLIIRGLDYYTGTVFETFFDDYPAVGSVCSGGRYENLDSCYTKEKLPGVGASIGLTRLFSQIKELGLLNFDRNSFVEEILVIPFSNQQNIESIKLAQKIKLSGKKADVLFVDGSLKKKFKIADKKRSKFVIVVGEDEISTGEFTVKNMETGEQQKISTF